MENKNKNKERKGVTWSEGEAVTELSPSTGSPRFISMELMSKLYECHDVLYDVNRRNSLDGEKFSDPINCDEKTREELISILSQLKPYLTKRLPLNLD